MAKVILVIILLVIILLVSTRAFAKYNVCDKGQYLQKIGTHIIPESSFCCSKEVAITLKERMKECANNPLDPKYFIADYINVEWSCLYHICKQDCEQVF